MDNYKIGSTKIMFLENEMTKEVEHANLEKLYKTIHEIAIQLNEDGYNVKNWFYNKEEIKEIKENSQWIKI